MGDFDPLYTAAPSTDHVVRGIARLPQEYQSSPKIVGLLTSYLNRIQEIENAAWEVITYRLLANASGVQLDTIGKIVSAGRGGLSDAAYSLIIQAEILINASDGTPDQMIAIAQLLLPEGYVFVYNEGYPAVAIFTGTTVPAPGENPYQALYNGLERAKAAGVELIVIYPTADPSEAFTFSPYPAAPGVTQSQGFANYYFGNEIGGAMAGAFGV